MLPPQMIKSVKDSIPALKEHGFDIVSLFYDLLFEVRPEWRRMFNSSNQSDGSGAQVHKLANAVIAYANHIEDPSVLLSFVQKIGFRHVSRGVKPEDYPVVGKCFLEAVSRVTGLTMEHEIIRSWASAYNVLADLFIAEEQRIRESMTARAGSWVGYREFSVAKKVKENYRTASLYLEPTDGAAIADFKPGQFVSVLHPELLEPRYYSLSSVPGSGVYRITVQKEPEQYSKSVSTHLVDDSREGDSIYLAQPTGPFSLKNYPAKPSVFIASGIGITPILPMISESLEKNIPTTIFHCVRNQQELIFRDHLLWLSDQRDVRVKMYFSESLPDFTDENIDSLGRIGIANIQQNLHSLDCHYYICGSEGFSQDMAAGLIYAGIAPEYISTESFDMGASDLRKRTQRQAKTNAEFNPVS